MFPPWPASVNGGEDLRRKKSFLLYFDTCEKILFLPDEQLGLLFRALVDCAQREADGGDGAADFEKRYPHMTAGTQMAFLLLAATLHRDAETYAEKSANYQNAAKRRTEARREQQRGDALCLKETQGKEDISSYAREFNRQQERRRP